MKEESDEFKEISEEDVFNQITDATEEELVEVEELTDSETEETTGGGKAVFAVQSAAPVKNLAGGNMYGVVGIGDLKNYGKHCGGIQLITKTPSVTVSKVGARIGIIDKIYKTKSSIPARVSGVGTSNLVVTRSSGKLGLVTLEIHGHQQGEPKNFRFVVVRVNFV